MFGASGGVFFALDADTGREVWRVSLGGNTKSAPISFTVDGRQVVARGGWTGAIRVWAVDLAVFTDQFIAVIWADSYVFADRHR